MFKPECKLGMYVLWTIESIRVRSLTTQPDTWGFPSQNPVLKLRNSTTLVLVTDNAAFQIASKAYFDWWEANKSKSFDEFKAIDPLQNTDYKWH
jgi:hypothetical protein